MKSHTEINTSKNGPLVVKGLKKLTESNGNLFPVKTKTIALCRCGASENKTVASFTDIDHV